MSFLLKATIHITCRKVFGHTVNPKVVLFTGKKKQNKNKTLTKGGLGQSLTQTYKAGIQTHPKYTPLIANNEDRVSL